MVVSAIRQDHLLHHPLDDAISRRAFKLFIEGLDPMKSYFYQSDIDEFMEYEDKLDDMLLRYDTRFAQFVFQRFLQRVDERVVMIDQLLQREFDFTLTRKWSPIRICWSTPRTERRHTSDGRSDIKYDLLLLKAEKANDEETVEGQEPVVDSAEGR